MFVVRRSVGRCHRSRSWSSDWRTTLHHSTAQKQVRHAVVSYCFAPLELQSMHFTRKFYSKCLNVTVQKSVQVTCRH